MANTKLSSHSEQKTVNEQFDRSALARTMKLGQSVEFSNGISIIFKKRKGTHVQLVLLIPREVRVYFPVYNREIVDEIDSN